METLISVAMPGQIFFVYKPPVVVIDEDLRCQVELDCRRLRQQALTGIEQLCFEDDALLRAVEAQGIDDKLGRRQVIGDSRSAHLNTNKVAAG